MAVYHELNFACALKEDTPQQVIDLLVYLISYLSEPEPQELKPVPVPVPDHPFFGTEGWKWLFSEKRSDFSGENFSSLVHDDDPLRYEITVRTSVRMGYERIAMFLHWLAPYVESEGVVGFTRSDVSWNIIALISFQVDGALYSLVDLYKNPPTVRQVKITGDKGNYDY